MRSELKKVGYQRAKFTGVFVRYGTKSFKRHVTITILLKDIKDENGKVVADHLWFNQTKGFEKLGVLLKGDTIEFIARVREYVKGRVSYRKYIDTRRTDYRLSHPTKIKRVH